MKRFLCLAALGLIAVSASTSFAQSRDLGAQRLRLDNGAGGSVTLQNPAAGTRTVDFPTGSSNTSFVLGNTTGTQAILGGGLTFGAGVPVNFTGFAPGTILFAGTGGIVSNDIDLTWDGISNTLSVPTVSSNSIRLKNGANYLTLQAPALGSSSEVFTFPPTGGEIVVGGPSSAQTFGTLTLGDDAVGPIQGKLVLHDNTGSNGFTQTVQSAVNAGQNTTLTVPDAGAASANFVLTNAAVDQTIDDVTAITNDANIALNPGASNYVSTNGTFLGNVTGSTATNGTLTLSASTGVGPHTGGSNAIIFNVGNGGVTTAIDIDHNGTVNIPNVNITGGTITGVAVSNPTLAATATSNQVALGDIAGGNGVTLNSLAPASGDLTYTIPDAGANASFVMTEGAQTVNGAKTFTGINVTSGTVASSTLSGALPAINGSNLTGLTAANITAGGTLPALNGSALTSLTAGNIAAGGSLPALNGSALTGLAAGNITPGGALPSLNGSALTNLTAGNIAAGGTLPALNGSALTNLTAGNITAGGTLPALDGSALTNLTAGNIAAGGTLPALNGSALTNVTAANITAGGTLPALNASALTNINAANIVGSATSSLNFASQNGIRLYDAVNSNYSAIVGADDMSPDANLTYKLPSAIGAAGNILSIGSLVGNVASLAWTTYNPYDPSNVSITGGSITIDTWKVKGNNGKHLGWFKENGLVDVNGRAGDDYFQFDFDPTGANKKAKFSIASISSATTRTYTLPDASGTIMLTGAGQNIVAGSLAVKSRTVTSSYTVASDDFLVVGTMGSAGQVITLPDAATCPGRFLYIQRNAGSQFDMTITAGSGDNIDGSSTKAFNATLTAFYIVSDGSNNWYVVSNR